MAEQQDYDVVVMGGGPVGMGLAIELGQRGIRVAVVERYPEPQAVPKGQNLTQRSMEHFHAWGAEAELRAARTVPREHGIGGLTCYGTLLSDWHYDWLQRELVRPYYFTDNERLPQYATEAVLRARAAAIPSVTIFYGWTGEAVRQDDSGAEVTITRRDGGGTMTLRGRYLVGCDGSRSRVRTGAGITETCRDHDMKMVLLVFRSTGLHRLLQRYPDKAFYSVLHPDLKGYWQFFGRVDLGTTWFFHAPVPHDATAENHDFAGLLHRAVGAEFDVAFDHVGFWDLRVALADQYRRGRIFLAGDAAHSHPPYGGYGINTGFEDARNLGWKLAATLQGWGGEALLDSYDAERRPVFASTARDFIEKFIEEDRDFLATHDPDRDLQGFRAAWEARAKGAPEVNAYEPNYRGSPIVTGGPQGQPSARGAHSHLARAGHHLSPFILPDGRNVYEALGPGFTLVARRADAGDVFARAAAGLGLPLTVIADAGDGAGEAGPGAALVLVRPDSFVAWTGEAADDARATAVLTRAAGLDVVQADKAARAAAG
ncbi:FAD-dependent monooxygenase [Halodurantibacterium flavum]|uniref:FAD-dependent monooxygenase n=1 Tax=Halodurantibacterium flavum TaxID=1382802 RepID=A0ABW4S0E9_9RHOB